MKDNNKAIKNKRGYLKEDFLFFHLKDDKNLRFEFHYHDFNKIIVFISGKVTYLIEGKSYKLKPWDILLISNQEIHKPIIQPGECYERLVIWINPVFLEKHNGECDLSSCFVTAYKYKMNLMRLSPDHLRNTRYILSQLEEEWKRDDFGCRILKNALFLQLIVNLNRLIHKDNKRIQSGDIEFDQKISDIITHINKNLNEDLSIDTLASKFFISKYHLMHKFKSQTGYSLHQYITHKRLIAANLLMNRAIPLAEVSVQCGFGDYSSFVRAFKKMYGLSPKQHYKKLSEIRNDVDGATHF